MPQIMHTVFPRIEAPSVYWYKRLGPPACIRGPAAIRGNTVFIPAEAMVNAK